MQPASPLYTSSEMTMLTHLEDGKARSVRAICSETGLAYWEAVKLDRFATMLITRGYAIWQAEDDSTRIVQITDDGLQLLQEQRSLPPGTLGTMLRTRPHYLILSILHGQYPEPVLFPIHDKELKRNTQIRVRTRLSDARWIKLRDTARSEWRQGQKTVRGELQEVALPFVKRFLDDWHAFAYAGHDTAPES